MPTIALAMPIYNAGRSILLKTHTDWELLIVNDASTDGALNLVADLLQDPRVCSTMGTTGVWRFG